MPRDRYKTLSSGTPTEALAIPKPLGGTSQRIREIAVRITRSCTFKRPSHGDDAPALNDEQDCRGRSSSSSSSTSSLQPSGRTRLYPPAQPEIDPSPSWTPKGCLVFVDSSAEFENDRHVAPPEDCSAGPENIEEVPQGDFEADEQARSSSPSNATRSDCLDPLRVSSSRPTCRVCGQGSNMQESLVPVCKCQDTTGLLHASCLERWLSAQNEESHCEACHSRFRPAVEFSTARLLYRWALFGEPHTQRALLGDLLLLALLTPVAALSCLLCARGASKRLMLGDVAQAAGLVTLAVIFTAAYVVWTFFAARVHYRAFAAWKTMHDPMHCTAATPPFVDRAGSTTAAGSTDHRRMSSARATSPRELVDVATGCLHDVESSSARREDGDVRQALSANLPSELPQQSAGFARQHSSRSGSIV